MKWIAKRVQQDPVAFQGVVQAGLALGIAFGVDISAEAMGAILAFSATLLSFLTRTQVTPLVNPMNADGKQLVPL